MSALTEADLKGLALDKKVEVIRGRDFWSTVGLPEAGLRSLTMSDGPSGVRGTSLDERNPSMCLPAGSALAASWNQRLAYRYGAALAAEAQSRQVDIVLGPMINLHRTPLAGRHFESLSEDPILTGIIATAYVNGLQDQGVAACPKHFVANDFETDRYTVDVLIDERTLRELYLRPFQMAVEGGAWCVMSAYNSVNGTTMSENPLLADVLVDEWGFDGVVISDWRGVRSVAAAAAAQHLAMPGPNAVWGTPLIDAIQQGAISEAVIDDKVSRLALLAKRTDPTVNRFLARKHDDSLPFEAEIESMVLLKNESLLPLAKGVTIAVIGLNAETPAIQGGGSSAVATRKPVGLPRALREADPNARIVFSQGIAEPRLPQPFPLDVMRYGSRPGLRVRMYRKGVAILDERRESSRLCWIGDLPMGPIDEVLVEFDLDWPADLEIAVKSGVPMQLTVDEETVLSFATNDPDRELGAALTGRRWTSTPILPLGAERVVTARFFPPAEMPLNLLDITIGFIPSAIPKESLLRDAVEAAATSHTAIVVVGNTPGTESEGHDRMATSLPPDQDELVRAIAAVNPRTVVIVNTGAPVAMPWIDEVSAVLLSWFGGDQMMPAIAAALLGNEEPAGRLPTTWSVQDDYPVFEIDTTGGAVQYREQLDIGHRAWLREGRKPAYPFGWGLGYTTWSVTPHDVIGDASERAVRVTVTNTGERCGSQVVQLYLAKRDSSVTRPVLWFAGFAKTRLAPSESCTLRVPINHHALQHWDSANSQWLIEPGAWEVGVATDVETCHAWLDFEIHDEVPDDDE